MKYFNINDIKFNPFFNLNFYKKLIYKLNFFLNKNNEEIIQRNKKE